MTATTARPPAPALPITVRRVRFAWEDTPLHWVPGDAQTSHTINVMHLLLPAGERWFCEVFRQALPSITDPVLRAEVRGFIGQEAVHARAHESVLLHLHEQGLDTQRYTDLIEGLFNGLLSDEPFGRKVPRPLAPRWLRARVAIIAAIEHYTTVLGMWVLENMDAHRAAGSDPVMLDLFGWHGAEEVEHRSVAFDLAQHLSGSWLRRLSALIAATGALFVLWVAGARFLMQGDPTNPGRASWTGYFRAARRGLLPTMRQMFGEAPGYLSDRYHPSDRGDTALAAAYLASSPAALAATRAGAVAA